MLIRDQFAVVNVVVVGQILSAVADYNMTITVGCVIIAVLSYLLSVFGFAVIHTFEKYSWIMTFILGCILVGQVGPHADASIPATVTGLPWSGAMLSFWVLNFCKASNQSLQTIRFPSDFHP